MIGDGRIGHGDGGGRRRICRFDEERGADFPRARVAVIELVIERGLRAVVDEDARAAVIALLPVTTLYES